MKRWTSTYFIDVLGPSKLALVGLRQGRPLSASWVPIQRAVQVIGGKRWTISFIRFGEYTHGRD